MTQKLLFGRFLAQKSRHAPFDPLADPKYHYESKPLC